VKLDDYMPAAQSEIFASHSAGDSRVVVTIETDGDWRLSFTDSVSTVTSYDITPTAKMEFFNKVTPALGFPSANHRPNHKAKE
jgi:hypothetical protein